MLKSNIFPTYRETCRKMEIVWGLMREYMDTSEEAMQFLNESRCYLDTEVSDFLISQGTGIVRISDSTIFGEDRVVLGLVSDSDNFLLNNRYVFPIRDIEGNILAFVGWYPDYKKYITTPSLFFSKKTLFFNLDDAYSRSMNEFDGRVFLVEGIFDCISLRCLGLPVVATMGADISIYKAELLKVFKHITAISDNDKAGIHALKTWDLPPWSTRVSIRGNFQTPYGELRVKDIDDLIKFSIKDDIRVMLRDLLYSDKSEEEIKLS